MTFFNIFKKCRCKHEYVLLNKYTEVRTSHSSQYSTITTVKCNIYCPKCKKRKVVEETEYEALREKWKIDKEFKNKGE